MTINSFKFTLPDPIKISVEAAVNEWRESKKIERIRAGDASVWTNRDEASWLGWLDIVDEELAGIDKYHQLQADLATAGFSDVLLLGMGGSSLCPEVLAMTFGKANFHILDSTVPAQVKAVEDKLDLERTLFIVASKSGSTLEPNCFKQYFFDRVEQRVGKGNAGRQFIAITDPGSKMEQVAKDDGFRYIFYGKPQIGGRFSALSAFGMTAGASMRLDVGKFLKRAKVMQDACSDSDPATNPAAILGLILGVCHANERDKLTIFTTPEIHDLGAWLEQLIAESTGKNDVAIIPVDREPEIDTAQYGPYRVFAFLSVAGNDSLDGRYDAVVAAGHPAIKIELNSIDDLGQEFFRWEFATAVAGSVMGINPFDQPDVESAKIEARKITDEYEKTGSLPIETPYLTEGDISLFAYGGYKKMLKALPEQSVAAAIDEHLKWVMPVDYFAILAYVPMNEENEALLQAIRMRVLERCETATCLGFGPRFLHSTGQAYKGGANNGVFLQITSDDPADIAVPGQKYTFGVVKAAQASGDLHVLINRSRRAVRVHIAGDLTAGLRRLAEMI